ncbi:MAG: MotA/TolQ/ExbB proton channel family protein [Deltaproteobacteria bacterium]|nr:MotA/TolQ/ExbB proton channel family protein [Deltaproteobacteria bacterium]
MIGLLLEGGPFMFGTLGVSLVCVAIFIWRVIYFFGRSSTSRAMLSQVVGFAETKNYANAVQLCSAKSTPLAKILKAALLRSNRTEKEIRRAVESTALEEVPKVRAGTVFLPQLSNLATLLGLIGTIHGLIIAFRAAGQESAAARQQMLSQGIAIAFYNTFFGLIVATIAIVFYLILLGRMNATIAFMEQAAATVVDAILWHRDGGGHSA